MLVGKDMPRLLWQFPQSDLVAPGSLTDRVTLSAPKLLAPSIGTPTLCPTMTIVEREVLANNCVAGLCKSD